MNYSCAVKIPVALVVLVAAGSLAPAQTNDVDVGDLLDAAQQWAQDNLDTNVVAAVLQNVDRQQGRGFSPHYQDYLKGDYVLDVAQLKDAANTMLPLLEAHEETQPYAAWLRVAAGLLSTWRRS